MGMARNVEVWIFGAFGGLVLLACLSGQAERATPRAAGAAPAVETAPPAGAVAETALAQPPGADQQTYVVYVTAKRPSAAQKRARNRAG